MGDLVFTSKKPPSGPGWTRARHRRDRTPVLLLRVFEKTLMMLNFRQLVLRQNDLGMNVFNFIESRTFHVDAGDYVVWSKSGSPGGEGVFYLCEGESVERYFDLSQQWEDAEVGLQPRGPARQHSAMILPPVSGKLTAAVAAHVAVLRKPRPKRPWAEESWRHRRKG